MSDDTETKAQSGLIFMPTWKEHIIIAKSKSYGLRWYEAKYFKKQKCWICDREEDTVLNTVEFVPVYMQGDVRYICSDHGGRWWNCFEGKWMIFSTTPYWYRRLRNQWLNAAINLIFLTRFIRYLIYDVVMWRIVAKFVVLWRRYERL